MIEIADANGQRLSGFEYFAWRRRAQGALNHCNNELRIINAWMRDAGRRAHAAERTRVESVEFDVDDVYAALLAAYGLLKKLARELATAYRGYAGRRGYAHSDGVCRWAAMRRVWSITSRQV